MSENKTFNNLAGCFKSCKIYARIVQDINPAPLRQINIDKTASFELFLIW